MTHKWIKQKDAIDDAYKRASVIAIHTCKICKCEKHTQRFRDKLTGSFWFNINYYRNGQAFDYYIECIDMEKENKHEIDDQEKTIMGFTR